jgi:hypothetical protein
MNLLNFNPDIGLAPNVETRVPKIYFHTASPAFDHYSMTSVKLKKHQSQFSRVM